jgi:transketolase
MTEPTPLTPDELAASRKKVEEEIAAFKARIAVLKKKTKRPPTPEEIAAKKARLKAKQREYFARNREKIRARVKAFNLAHREEINAKHRKYYQTHRDRILSTYREYYTRTASSQQLKRLEKRLEKIRAQYEEIAKNVQTAAAV